jgi:integrase
MNLREHDGGNEMKVWLSAGEADRLMAAADDTEERIAFGLGVRCGLRSVEWLNVVPRDVVDTDAGTMLRVWSGAKGDKFRETPIPSNLATTIRTVADVRDAGPDEPVLSVESTRTLRRWLASTAEELAEETDDSGWRHLSTHDLRRTWATALADAEVDPLLALEWGGWEDLETFLEHYKGAYSPAAKRRAREKVDWLA